MPNPNWDSDIFNLSMFHGMCTKYVRVARPWLCSKKTSAFPKHVCEEQILRAYLKRNSEEVPTGDDKAILGRLNKGEDTPKRKKEGTVVKGFNFTPDSAKEIEEIRTRALAMEGHRGKHWESIKIRAPQNHFLASSLHAWIIKASMLRPWNVKARVV